MLRAPATFFIARAPRFFSRAMVILECHSIVPQRNSRPRQKAVARRRAYFALFPRRSSFSFATTIVEPRRPRAPCRKGDKGRGRRQKLRRIYTAHSRHSASESGMNRANIIFTNKKKRIVRVEPPKTAYRLFRSAGRSTRDNNEVG